MRGRLRFVTCYCTSCQESPGKHLQHAHAGFSNQGHRNLEICGDQKEFKVFGLGFRKVLLGIEYRFLEEIPNPNHTRLRHRVSACIGCKSSH